MCRVAFDLHAAAAAIALLSSPKLVIQESLLDPETGGQTRKKCCQGLSMRFT
jgi:hypothetical protein